MSPSCYSPLGLGAFLLAPVHIEPTCLKALQSLQTVPHVSALAYLAVFGMTCILEVPFYFGAFGSRGTRTWAGLRSRVESVIVANLCTHPMIYLALPRLVAAAGGLYVHTLACAEMFAPAVEAWMLIRFWKVPGRRALPWAVAANLFSWWAGIYLV